MTIPRQQQITSLKSSSHGYKIWKYREEGYEGERERVRGANMNGKLKTAEIKWNSNTVRQNETARKRKLSDLPRVSHVHGSQSWGMDCQQNLSPANGEEWQCRRGIGLRERKGRQEIWGREVRNGGSVGR